MSNTYTPQPHTSGPIIEAREDYVEPNAPGGGPSRYWQDEIKASQYLIRRWHRHADLVTQRYLDHRVSTHGSVGRGHGAAATALPAGAMRLNLFYSNVSTQLNLLYGRLPQVDVSRRFNDANDDVGRVAATLLERILNNDVQDHDEEYDSVLRAVLEDRLVPGAGIAKVRYEVSTQDTEVAPVTDMQGNEIAPARTETRVADESAPVDYFHWRDVLWPWARTWADLRWLGFRSFLTKKEWEDRFPDVPHTEAQFKQQQLTSDNSVAPEQPELNDNWQKAEVWEIWDKETRTVYWVNMDTPTILDSRPDPLELRDFFPSPRFLIANPSTSLFIPTPDFHLAQDLYHEIDKLQTRISIITEAVKVVGVYDASTPEVGRMLKEGTENDLIPVDKWALFAEKGGLQGQIDWFPIEAVVNALVNLRQLRDETIALLYQVTGMSDILRGQLDNQYEGVGQSRDKVMFGSIRVQGVQEQFATFVSDLMTLKADIVTRHFDAETIARYSNASHLFDDLALVQQAIQLLKDPEQAKFRIKVKADSLAQVDYQRTQAERTEFLTAISAFLAATAPLTEQEPATAPFLMQLLQWGLSGFRGADEIEGVIDRAITATQQAQQNQQQQPDPEQLRLQMQMQLEQQKAQAQMQIQQAKTQAALQERQADLFADVETARQQHLMEMAQQEAELRRELAQIEAKARADMAVETHQSQANAMQNQVAIEGEIRKDIVEHQLELDTLAAETAKSISEARVQAAVKRIPTPSSGGSESDDSL